MFQTSDIKTISGVKNIRDSPKHDNIHYLNNVRRWSHSAF